MPKPLPTYDVHPISIKMLRRGHPWIIKDKFTDKFHPRDRFIVAKEKNRPIALLIHDPRHAKVKARVWADRGDFQGHIKNFRKDLSARIEKAVSKRKNAKYIEERENFYLVFGEADRLPGLHVQYLGGELLFQFYSFFWESYEGAVIEEVIKAVNLAFEKDITKANCWTQKRADGDSSQKTPKSLDPNCDFRSLTVKEFGIDYKVELGKNYDCGLYTDMAQVRSDLKKDFQNAGSVLNLYSYTGAFSLFALKNGAKEVVSVDLSEPYLDTLSENIKKNGLDQSAHTPMQMSCKSALGELAANNKEFDLIISDPPSSSSDGNKRTNALKDYERELPKIAKLLSKKGKACVFLNTRGVTRNKFEKKIQEIVQAQGLKLRVERKLALSGDCPYLKGFPEGAYLKGLVLVRD